jgi:small-conductance mechanosensitive channel
MLTDPLLYVMPVSIAVAGVLVGYILERVVLARLRAHGTRAGRSFEILSGGMKGLVLLWCSMLGLYLATRGMPLTAEARDLLGRALMVASIASLTLALARIVSGIGGQLATRSGDVVVATSIFTNLLRIVVFLLGALMAMQALGIPVTPVLTALGVGGLAVALALQDPLGNLFAGLQILIAKQLRPGDYIRIDSGHEGTISDIAWRNTTIRTGGNNMVVVPNLKLASAIVTNFTLPEPDLALTVAIGVGYGSDLERVERVAAEVAQQVLDATGSGVAGHPAVVRYQAFGDSSIVFEAVMRVRSFDAQASIRHAFIKALHVRFRSEGIEIPFPVRTVHLVAPGTAPAPPPA